MSTTLAPLDVLPPALPRPVAHGSIRSHLTVAIGLSAARHRVVADEIDPFTPVVTLATAHPAKFRDAVERATGQRPQVPARIGDLFAREERYDMLPGGYDAVRAYVAERATPAPGVLGGAEQREALPRRVGVARVVAPEAAQPDRRPGDRQHAQHTAADDGRADRGDVGDQTAAVSSSRR